MKLKQTLIRGKTARFAGGKETGGIFDRMDCFGQTVSSFNIEGNDKVGTAVGGLFSGIILVLMLTYAGIKFNILFSKAKPLITATKLIDKN